jgi:hypothetical protein
MELATYKTFFEQERATALVDLLKENGIEVLVTEDRESLDSLYGQKQFRQQYFVKIKKDDFKKADSILIQRSADQLAEVDKDHYLFTFTNDELHDILSKPDEWSEFDYLLAQKILKDRGGHVSDEKIAALKDERMRELAKPDEKNRGWIYAGYVFAILGGLLGIFIGWHLSTFKKTLPNGETVHGYTVEDRAHGNRILIIGLFMFMFLLGLRIFGGED